MAQTILIKRSNTSGAVPTTSQLSVGELALNTRDGKIYMRKYVDGTTGNDTITLIGDTSTIAGSTFTGNLNLGDNVKAQFGASNDLQIYHSGTHSHIRNTTGNLYLQDDGYVEIGSPSGEVYIGAIKDGAVNLRHDNAIKLATTSTGIDVTGSVVADGLTVAKNGNTGANTNTTGSGISLTHGVVAAADQGLALRCTGSGFNGINGLAFTSQIVADTTNSNALEMFTTASSPLVLGTNATKRLNLASNGDISFYNDSAAQGLFWDSSASSLGIGVTNPSASYAITANRGFKSEAAYPNFTLVETDSSNQTWQINSTGASLSFRDVSRAADRLTINTAGNATFSGSVTANAGVVVDNITIDGNEIDVGSGDLTLDVAGKINLDHGSPEILLKDDGAHYASFISSNTDFVIQSIVSDKDMLFKGQDGSSTITALTLDMSNSGSASFNNNVNIGSSLMVGSTTAPSSRLHIKAADNNYTGGILIEDTDSLTKSGITHVNGGLYLSSNATNDHLEINSSGNATFSGAVTAPNLYVADDIGHSGDADTYLSFETNSLSHYMGGTWVQYSHNSGTSFPNGTVMIGSTSTASAKLQVQGGTSGLDQISISSNSTANTVKYAGIIMTNYANTTTALLGGKAENGTTSVFYGSSGSDHRGVQNHIFYTNASATATSGNTERGRFNSSGLSVSGSVTSTGLEINGTRHFDADYNVTYYRKANHTLLGYQLHRDNGISYYEWNTGGNHSHDFQFVSDNSPVLSLATNGNVNIPNGGLAIAKTSAPDALLDIDTGTVSSAPSARFRRNHGAQAFQQLSGLSFYWNTSNGFQDNTIVYGADANSSLKFTHATGSAFHDRLTIDSSGNVGIGVTPASGIQLQLGNSANNSAVTRVTNGTVHVDLTASSSGKAFLEVGTNHPLILATDAQERMQITAAGKVFIGDTTASNAQLRVKQSTDQQWTANFINHQNTAYGLSIDTSSAGNTGAFNFAAYTPANTGFFVQNDGDVGIGTAAPSHLLDILKTGSGDATINIKSTTGGDPTIIFNSAAANRSGLLKFQDNGTNVGRIEYVHNGDRIDFQAGSATSATMSVANGKVGIGTSSPAGPLHVDGHTGSLATILEGNGNGDTVPLHFRVKANNNNVTNHGIFGNAGSTGADNSIHIGPSNTSGLSVNSSGAIKFNNAFTFPTADGSANQLLKTDGSGNMSWVTVSGAGTPSYIADADGDTKIQVEENSDEDKIRFDTAGVERMIIDNAGNVGIGTDTPTGYSGQTNLNINSTGVSRIDFDISDTLEGYLLSEAGYLAMWGVAGSHLRFGSSNTERMRIDTSGRVGIGITAPTHKLHVKNDNDYAAKFGGTGGGDYSIEIGQGTTNSSAGFNATGSSGSMLFKISDSEKMRIKYDGNVGIGTNSPDQPLHVVGADSGIKISSDASDRPHLSLFNGTSEMLRLSANNLYGAIGDSTNGQRYMVFKAGNVGIGTTAPAETLTVSGTGAVSSKFAVMSTAVHNSYDFYNNGTSYLNGSLTVDDVLDITGSSAALKVAGTTVIDSNRRILAADGAANVPYITFASDTNTGLYRPGADILGFSTAGSERVRIDASGNVGIGTTTPYSLLEINRTATDAYTATSFNDVPVITLKHTNADTQYAGIRFTNTAGNYEHFLGSVQTGSNTADMVFQGYNRTVGSYQEHMRVTEEGKLGIGTNSPGSLLTVHNSSTAGNTQLHVHNNKTGDAAVLRLEGGRTSANDAAQVLLANGGYIGSAIKMHSSGSQEGDMRFYVSGASSGDSLSEAMRIGTNGAVSIGTTTAAGAGGLLVSNDIKGNSRIGVGSGGNLSDASLYKNDDTNTGIYWPAADTLGFTTAGAERLRFNSGGSALFNSASTALMASFDNTQSTGGYLRWMENGAASFFIGTSDTVGGGSGGFYDLYAVAGLGQRFFTGAAERMRIESGGNVGIGTSSPSRKLTVAGGAASNDATAETVLVTGSQHVKSVIESTSTTGHRATLELRSDGGDKVSIATWGNNHMLFDLGGSEKMRLQGSTGNLGIGTTAPAAKLHIGGSGHILFERGGEVRSKDTGGNVRTIARVNGSNELEYGWSANAPVKFMGGGSYTERMRIHTNGKVGIGTSAPSSALHIQTNDGTTNTAVNSLTITNLSTGTTTTGFGGEIRFQAERNNGVNQNTGSIRSIAEVNSGTNISSGLAFDTSAVGVNSEKLRISYDGKIGGNTSSPQYPLDLRNPSDSNQVFRVYFPDSATTQIGTSRMGSGAAQGLFVEGQAGVRFGVGSIEYGRFHTNGNLGIGTTAPKAKLQVEVLGIETNQSSVTSTSQFECESFPAADFRSARYTIQVTNVTDSTYHVTEILLIHDGTTPAITEFATIFTGSAAEATFDADINSGNVRLLATPASSDNMQFKVVRHSILV